jgi:hypothetical protein
VKVMTQSEPTWLEVTPVVGLTVASHGDVPTVAAAAGGARAIAPARRPALRLAAPTTDRARRETEQAVTDG